MTYFLDTNICIYFLKGSFSPLLERFRKKRPEEIRIASIVKAELLLGAVKSKNPVKTEKLLKEFILPYTIIPFDDAASVYYSKIRGALEKKGNVIGPNDLILAATVLANEGTLVTNNVTEFKRINDLKIENWTEAIKPK